MRKPSLDGPQSCHEPCVGESKGQPGDAHWQTIGKPRQVHEQVVATINKAKQGGCF